MLRKLLVEKSKLTVLIFAVQLKKLIEHREHRFQYSSRRIYFEGAPSLMSAQFG